MFNHRINIVLKITNSIKITIKTRKLPVLLLCLKTISFKLVGRAKHQMIALNENFNIEKVTRKKTHESRRNLNKTYIR